MYFSITRIGAYLFWGDALPSGFFLNKLNFQTEKFTLHWEMPSIDPFYV